MVSQRLWRRPSGQKGRALSLGEIAIRTPHHQGGDFLSTLMFTLTYGRSEVEGLFVEGRPGKSSAEAGQVRV